MTQRYPIWACFVELGAPRTGLTPTIKIRRLDNGALVVNNGILVELGDGNYVYNFDDFDDTLFYCWTIDAGVDLTNVDRYAFGVSDEIPAMMNILKRIYRG